MENYIKIDQQIHWLSQVLAKANRTFLESKPDDSRTNLYFDSFKNRIFGRWIQTNQTKISTSYNINNQSFEILDSKFGILFSTDTVGKNLSNIEEELKEAFANFGLNTEHFSDDLHFKIPDYGFNKVEEFNKDSLSEWIYFRTLANQICYEFLGYTQSESEVRIWPHHFDTGIYFKPNETIGIGFGLAMADDLSNVPYFYLAGYALNGKQIVYENLPQSNFWQWKLGHFKGAILPLNHILGLNKESQANEIQIFIEENFNWFIRL